MKKKMSAIEKNYMNALAVQAGETVFSLSHVLDIAGALNYMPYEHSLRDALRNAGNVYSIKPKETATKSNKSKPKNKPKEYYPLSSVVAVLSQYPEEKIISKISSLGLPHVEEFGL